MMPWFDKLGARPYSNSHGKLAPLSHPLIELPTLRWSKIVSLPQLRLTVAAIALTTHALRVLPFQEPFKVRASRGYVRIRRFLWFFFTLDYHDIKLKNGACYPLTGLTADLGISTLYYTPNSCNKLPKGCKSLIGLNRGGELKYLILKLIYSSFLFFLLF
jgi:hypothetical protein